MSLHHWENCLYNISMNQKHNLELALNYLLQLKSLLVEKVENFQEPISFNPPELPIDFKILNNKLNFRNNCTELQNSTNENLSKNDFPADYILIQCLTSLGEVIGILAHNCSKEKEWQNASELYLRSYNELNSALIRADYNIAIVVNDDLNKHIPTNASASTNKTSCSYQHKEKLLNMCDALYIATGFSYNKMKEFCNISNKRKLYLEQQLIPLLTTRNEIKSKIGHEKWVNNPTPKNDYAEKRKPLELELKDIQLACSNMNDHQLEVSYHEIQKQSKQLLITINQPNINLNNCSSAHTSTSSPHHNNRNNTSSNNSNKLLVNTCAAQEGSLPLSQQPQQSQYLQNNYGNYYHHNNATSAIVPPLPLPGCSSIHPLSVGYSYFPYPPTGLDISMQQQQQQFHSDSYNFHAMQSMLPTLPHQNYPRTYHKPNARHGKVPLPTDYSLYNSNALNIPATRGSTIKMYHNQVATNQHKSAVEEKKPNPTTTTYNTNTTAKSYNVNTNKSFGLEENYSGSSEKK